MLFSACRFTELDGVDMSQSAITEDGVYLDTSLKTLNDRTEIAVPFPSEVPFICPASAIRTLWETVQTKNCRTTHLLLNTDTFEPLTVSGIRRLAKDAMEEAGIPRKFTPYSLKSATLFA